MRRERCEQVRFTNLSPSAGLRDQVRERGRELDLDIAVPGQGLQVVGERLVEQSINRLPVLRVLDQVEPGPLLQVTDVGVGVPLIRNPDATAAQTCFCGSPRRRA